jgi:hypothetical protein
MKKKQKSVVAHPLTFIGEQQSKNVSASSVRANEERQPINECAEATIATPP